LLVDAERYHSLAGLILMMDPHKKHSASVLVAEDEAIILAGVTLELEAAGFAVTGASDAQEALKAFEHHPEVTVVFSDINMPGLHNGLWLAHAISERRPSVRLILTSGRGRPPAAEMPAGCAFLPKPYTGEALAALINLPAPEAFAKP
jgi:CheY-like chemotaxis protein